MHRLDSAILRGGGGLATPEGRPADGKVVVELTSFREGAALDLAMSGGAVEIRSSDFAAPTRVRGVDPEGSRGNRVSLFVIGCVQYPTKPGFLGGLVVENVADVVIQSSRMAGSLTAVRDWETCMRFDANKVNSDSLEFTHTEAGKFGKATVVKCDVYSSKFVAKAPAAKGVKDVLPVDRCWFKGVTDPKALMEKVVADGSKDEANGAHVAFGKVNDRPLELAGSVDR